jgi:nicotinate-nucleotide pyrophosphorylase (carboxylating)
LTNLPDYLSPAAITRQVRAALEEDLGRGDDPTAAGIPSDAVADGRVICRERGVLAGAPWFEAAFTELDPDVTITWYQGDGDPLSAGAQICHLHGPARAIVSAERTALNFLQTLSGTATTTRTFVQAAAGTDVDILDTRKTLPGLRLAQKYAVLCGGGTNHRLGLFDAILIKENHIAAAGSIPAAVTTARHHAPKLPLEVEVETVDQLLEAMDAGADRILLDNMDTETLQAAVEAAGGHVVLEASGNMTPERVSEVAQTGVDCISVGALTKDVRALDLSLRLDAIGT